jgi:hypothetical protein
VISVCIWDKNVFQSFLQPGYERSG